MYNKKYYFYTKTKVLGAGRLLPRPRPDISGVFRLAFG